MAILMLRSAAAAAQASFDYYISTTGSDSNPGTLASPWAITAFNSKQAIYAGKRVGLLPGTYDVSAMMNATYHTPVLNINGGPNSSTRTFIGSSDASGFYSARTATLDAKGASGVFGGGNANTSAVIGQGNEVNVGSNWGNWTIDGLKITGFSLWAVHVGNYDASGGAVPNATIQNCEIHTGSGQSSTAASGVNLAPIVIYTATNPVVTNNYVHDNFGWTDVSHFSGIYVWGLINSVTGLQFTYNTFINTGNVHQKESATYNSVVAYNYVDMTNKTPARGTAGQNESAIFGFNADNGGLGTLTEIHHNVLLAYGAFINTDNDTGQNGWYTPVKIYNNTMVLVGSYDGNPGVRYFEMTTGIRKATGYNNLWYDGGNSMADYGYVQANADFAALWDYNIYGGHERWSTVPNGQQSSAGYTARTTLAAWKSATGIDSNSSSTTTNPFTNNGARALQFQVQSGSPAYLTGKSDGTSGGSAVNVGAWDGIVTQIGCNF